MNRQCSLAQLIIDEHDQLTEMDKMPIEKVIEGKTKQKVLLLLDGYDEYTAGTNKDIDRAIESGVENALRF